jgi:hypothetical protein
MVLNVKITANSKPGGTDLAFNVRRYGQKISMKERESIWVWGETVIKTAQENLHKCKKTGELEESIGNPARNGIFQLSDKGFSLIIGTRVEHAPHINYGTNPHAIKAKNKKTLAFKDKYGKKIFRRQVMHPGIDKEECKFFMDRAVNEANRILMRTLGEEVRV